MPTAAHTRDNRSLLAAAERRLLIRIAERLPAWVESDHLSALGFFSMIGAGLSFWLAGTHPVEGVSLVVICLFLNWFGDSLDGTLARVRNRQRPRYGYYLDHVVDLAGTALLFTGLAASGYMDRTVAAVFVASFYLVSAETYLATHSRGIFKMSFLAVGPTELRILLAAGAVMLIFSPRVKPFGLAELRLFDLGGMVGVAGMVAAFLYTSGSNIRALYLEETRRD
jgi:phosphatidylglycerophosphate synthase